MSKPAASRPTVFGVVNGVLLVVIAILCLYPLVYILSVSLSDGRAVQSGEVTLLPIGFNVETYRYIFSSPRLGILRALGNSFLYTAVATVVAVTLTYMTAYALSKKSLPGRGLIMMLFVITWIFDAGIVPTYIVNQHLGLVNNWLIMVLPLAQSTFLLIIARSFLEQIPSELEESASIDGAGDARIMTRIYFPLSTPAVATIGIFYAVQTWNQFLFPLIYLQDKALQPIQLVLYRLLLSNDAQAINFERIVANGHQILPQNIRAATMVCAIVPILAFYPYAQRYFSKGIMLGAVKG